MNKDNQTPVPGQEPENEIRQQDVSDVTCLLYTSDAADDS